MSKRNMRKNCLLATHRRRQAEVETIRMINSIIRQMEIIAIFTNICKSTTFVVRRVNGWLKGLTSSASLACGQGHDDLIAIVLVKEPLCLSDREGDWLLRRTHRLCRKGSSRSRKLIPNMCASVNNTLPHTCARSESKATTKSCLI